MDQVLPLASTPLNPKTTVAGTARDENPSPVEWMEPSAGMVALPKMVGILDAWLWPLMVKSVSVVAMPPSSVSVSW